MTHAAAGGLNIDRRRQRQMVQEHVSPDDSASFDLHGCRAVHLSKKKKQYGCHPGSWADQISWPALSNSGDISPSVYLIGVKGRCRVKLFVSVFFNHSWEIGEMAVWG